MTLFSLLLSFGGAILGFFLLVDGISYILANTGGRGSSRSERRLAGEKPEDDGDPIEIMARQEGYVSVTPFGKYYEDLATQANMTLPPYRLYLYSLVLTGLVFLVVTLILSYVPAFIALPVAAITGFAMPVLYLKRKARERVNKFQDQFPEAVDLIVRSLRVGHPLSAALNTIATEIPDPLGAEFEIASRQVTYGKSTPEAINAMTQRIDLSDLRFFAVAVQIHHEAGGNLAEILHGLSSIIRGRFHLFRKVRALTVEGRFSAWFLSLFPIVMIFVMGGLQPGYYQKASDFAYFPHLVVATFILLIVNVIAMRMITKLEV